MVKASTQSVVTQLQKITNIQEFVKTFMDRFDNIYSVPETLQVNALVYCSLKMERAVCPKCQHRQQCAAEDVDIIENININFKDYFTVFKCTTKTPRVNDLHLHSIFRYLTRATIVVIRNVILLCWMRKLFFFFCKIDFS